MNNLDKKYTTLLQDILDNGVEKKDRTGTGTLSVFGRQIRHKMSEGFPLLTTKKMYFKGVVTELLWFLRGETNIKTLVDNDCHIWDGDAYKNYLFNSDWFPISSVNGGFIGTKTDTDEIMTQELFINKIKTDEEFAEKWGDLGPVYGAQWRAWTYLTREQKEDIDGIDELICGADMWDGIRHYRTFDQIANSINLLKTDSDSRRNKVSAWNVGELDEMTLPPCHTDFQFYTRELSLEERLLLADKINKEIRQDLYTYVFNNPIYTGGIDQRPDDVERHDLLSDLNIPTRAISLMWNQRSVDTFLGLPFNIASYGLLLEIIAKAVNMVPDELIGNLGDVHLYLNHIEQAKEQIGRKFTEEEIHEHLQQSGMDALMIDARARYIDSLPNKTREPYPLPSLKHLKTDDFYKTLSEDLSLLNHLENTDFIIENYQSHPTIKAPLSN
jgi:thymidylate synthase